MGPFYFLFLLLSLTPTFVYSQACDHTSFPANGGTVNCTTLDINTAVDYSLPQLSGSTPVEFIVTGDVHINANIILDGDNGVTLVADPTNGPAGGPGAGDGGGILASDGQAGTDLTPSAGGSTLNNGTCNHGGGGGGGVSSAGQDGAVCTPPGGAAGAGGVIVPPAEFDFAGPFRGGYGGGAGGAFPLGGGVFDLGSGGGGGGAIHIQSTGGRIIIASGVKISARGGNGGNATNLGGAGGGGSGGVIWLEGALGITNNGTLDVRGGTGGTNTRPITPRGGNGGNGGNGIFRLNNAGTITDGTGLSAPASSSSAATKFTSDISCGSVAVSKQDDKNIYQMMMGFVFALMIGLVLKALSKVRVYSK